MIRRTKKKILISVILILLIALIGGTIAGIISFKSNEKINEVASEEKLDFSAKRLIITTEEDTILDETYNAKSVNKTYSGKYVIRYETEEETKIAYENFKKDKRIKDISVGIGAKINDINTMTIIQNIGGTNLESWGVYAMGLDETQEIINSKTTKDEIVVAVVDTGFDLNNAVVLEQSLLQRIDSRYINVTNELNEKDISDNHSEIDNETNEHILIGHGTHVGGIILDGTSDNVKILPIKVEDDSGEMIVEYLCDAIRYAIDAQVDVINISLGIELKAEDINNQDAKQIIGYMQQLVEEANSKGIVVIAAVGNGDENGIRVNGENIYPAAYPDVIGVGALQSSKIVNIDYYNIEINSYIAAKQSQASDLTYTPFSNYGVTVDFSAPGQYILSLVPEGALFYSFPLMDGTSQASPHIAAAVATLKSYNKDWNVEDIEEILIYYSEDLGTTGKDQDYGNGYVNFNDFEECTCGSENCDEIYCFGCTNTECIYHVVSDKVLESIELTTSGVRTEYTEGEKFDTTGLIVTAIYSDGSSQKVTDYTHSPEGELTTADTKIIITYQDKTAEIGITVKAKQVVQNPTLSEIELNTNAVRTEYTEGDRFDTTGLVVTAKYSDGSSQKVTDYTHSPEGELTTADTKIIITYQDKTAEIGITVKEKPVTQKTLTRIELITDGVKKEYTEGEKIDITALIVIAKYSDGTEKTIDKTNYSSFPITELTPENNKITISYTEDGITVKEYIDITVKAKQVVQEKTLKRIELTTSRVRTEYIEGEKFDTTGLIVEAIYSDGSAEIVTGYTHSPVGELTTSDTKILVTYQGKTAEIGITVKAKQAAPEKTLQSIAITTKPNKTEYTEGEKFSKTGMIVTAKYSDGSSNAVTDYSYSPSGELKTTDTKVIITYQGKTAEIEITVKAKQATPEKTLQSIAVTTKPNKTEYTEGEKFSKTGMIVTATYSDGSSNAVTNYTYSPSGELKTTDTKVIITYQGKTTEVGITVNAKQVENITVDKDNTIKDGNIADTGVEGIVIPIAIISVIVIVAIIGNIKYKDI